MALLNLNNVPGNIISGMNSSELEWLTTESSERFVFELSDDFLSMLDGIEFSEDVSFSLIDECNELHNRQTGDLDQSIQEKMTDVERESIPLSSRKQMNAVINRLQSFLNEKQLNGNILTLPSSILNNYLRYFYSELRQKDGSFYSPKSLICFRGGIHRYLCLHRPDINIFSSNLISSNQTECFLQWFRSIKMLVRKKKAVMK